MTFRTVNKKLIALKAELAIPPDLSHCAKIILWYHVHSGLRRDYEVTIFNAPHHCVLGSGLTFEEAIDNVRTKLTKGNL